MAKVRRKSVTMEDVAREADVSVTTVSHVINQTANISVETTERVQNAIQRMGYMPRVTAELNKGQRLIGVLVPEITNEFYARAIQSIIDEAWIHNYAVVVCSVQHKKQNETSYIRCLLQSGVKGLIFFGGATDDEQQIIDAAKRVPVVVGDRRLPNYPIDMVSIDNTDIMRRVIARLARAGYHRIGYISEDLIMSNATDRYRGYRMGMEECGLSIDDQWVFLRAELRLDKVSNTQQFLRSILRKRSVQLPQILLCTSDLIAVGAMAALREAGYAIPKDVGIIGFDDIPLAACLEPPLTTVSQDTRQLGRSCFQVLLNRLGHAERAYQEVVIRSDLIVRNSVRL